MARPAHPNSHDQRLRDILEASRHEERLVPCPDLATAKLMRSRFKEIIRAHREWKTGHYEKFKGIRFKTHETHLVLPVRPEYLISEVEFPYTLSIDGRAVMDKILNNVSGSSNTVPLTRAPQNASAAPYLDDDDDDFDSDDAYEAISRRYKLKDPAHAEAQSDEEDHGHD